jgi:hypothetical protein
MQTSEDESHDHVVKAGQPSSTPFHKDAPAHAQMYPSVHQLSGNDACAAFYFDVPSDEESLGNSTSTSVNSVESGCGASTATMRKREGLPLRSS